MKTRLAVISEYSKGRTFEEAVDNLIETNRGLMNGGFKKLEVPVREMARRFFHSWFCERHQEAEVKYIIVEVYDEGHEQWLIDYSAGVEVLPCQ